MKPKTVTIDGKTYIVTDDAGLPIYEIDGKEVGFDAVGTTSRIAALNREAQGHREAKEAAEGKLKGFEGIENAEDARKALETMKNLKAGDLKTAEQVEEIKRQARIAAEEQVQQTAKQMADQLKTLEGERDKFRTELFGEKVGGAFSRSPFVKDKLTIPADIAQRMFGDNFKIEDGKIVPYAADGQKIWSKSKPGEVADFEEGLESIIGGYGNRAAIVRGTGNSGTGAGHGGGGGGGQGQGGKPQMTRQAFEALPPDQRAAAVKNNQIVDTAA